MKKTQESLTGAEQRAQRAKGKLSLGEWFALSCTTALMCVVIFAQNYLADKSAADEQVFAAAASLAGGVLFAHRQWRENGFQDGDSAVNLQGFRRETFDMTFNGWPRGTSANQHHTNMTQLSCSEIWLGLVDDRWRKNFTISADAGGLGLCRFNATKTDGVVEYDVRRGRVVLTMG